MVNLYVVLNYHVFPCSCITYHCSRYYFYNHVTENSSQLHFTGKRCAMHVRISVMQSGSPVSCRWGACKSNWWMAMVSFKLQNFTCSFCSIVLRFVHVYVSWVVHMYCISMLLKERGDSHKSREFEHQLTRIYWTVWNRILSSWQSLAFRLNISSG